MIRLEKVRTVIITLFLISIGFFTLINFEFEIVDAYVLHNPIKIDGNDDFISSNGVTSGSGTLTDPFIIENWLIAPEKANGIVIKNTDKHFLIRNIWIHHSYYGYHGIYFSNVINGQIKNINVSDCYNSITISGSSNLVFNNLTVYKNSNYGLNIETSTDISIINNNILNCRGIRTFYSTKINISNNLIKSNNLEGIHVEYSNEINIHNNLLLKNECGILLDFSTNTTITKNILNSNGFFIKGDSIIYYSSHTITNDNIINGKNFYFYKNEYDLTVNGNDISIGQLIIVNCTNISITNAYINNTDVGIEMVFVKGAIISQNTIIKSNEDGIYFSFSKNITIRDNDISENNGYGIRYDSSINILIINNVISFNNWYAIASSSNNVSIMNNNIFSNNQYGIMVSGPGNSTVAGNNISSNMFVGIGISYASNVTISNNKITSNRIAGIEPFHSDMIVINGNEVFNNSIGIRFYESTNSIITRNVIESNYNYGLYFDISENIKIYHNKIINNNHQAFDNNGNENSWDDGDIKGGNYWSDYTGYDNDGDGFGDDPYEIDKNSNDNYPLNGPYIDTPNAPSGLNVKSGDSFVNITWDINVDIDMYPISKFSIYKSTKPGRKIFYVDIGNQNYYNDTNVTNGITYFYTISATNLIGEGPRSDDVNATSWAPIIYFFPECTILSPLEGAVIGEKFKIFGTASYQNGSIEFVEIRVGYTQWIKANGTTSWSYTWDTNSVMDGKYLIFARAFGSNNYSSMKSVNVTVNNSEVFSPLPSRPKHTEDSSMILLIIIITVIVVIIIIISSFIILRRKLLHKRNYNKISQKENIQKPPMKKQEYRMWEQKRRVTLQSRERDEIKLEWDDENDLEKY